MKPLPTVLPLERPFWAHARAHRLALQRCDHCGVFRYPASPVCAECDSDQSSWTETVGLGTVLSWVVFHKSYFASFNDDVPYNVALIKVDEGPVLCTNIVGIDNDMISAGLRVKVVFDEVNQEFSIPRFAPL
jgi:uncharacterized OB-fold protein